MPALQKLVAKHRVTRSGSKTQIAKRLIALRAHVLPRNELDRLEDFLQMPPAKRYHGSRIRVDKKGVPILDKRGDPIELVE